MAWTKVRKAAWSFWERWKDVHTPASPSPARLGKRALARLARLDLSEGAVQDLPEIAMSYAAHRFDLLGSGWARWGYTDSSPGLEGHRYDMRVSGDPLNSLSEVHQEEATRVWTLIRDPSYQPIDWQKDVKSGFRFQEARRHRDQPVGVCPGVDIKTPWEIGRLQHLPQMALAAALLKGDDPETARVLACEYRSQTLDFLAMNPVRMGCQWTCTMDVGIRAANLALAHDLFRQLDFRDIVDAQFEAELGQGLRRHGQHIISNLEWSEALTSNHYLANVCGLLFLSAALEATPETDAWLAFAAHELNREFFKQFYEDGVNFEGSTSYHCLSLEMAGFSAALVLGLPPERLPCLRSPDKRYLPATPSFESDWPARVGAALRDGDPARLFSGGFFQRLLRAALFIVDITKPSNQIPQIGDNDSGRFFRLTPLGAWITPEAAEHRYANLKGYCALIAPYRKSEERFFDEDPLNRQAAVGAVAGVVDHPRLASGRALEKSICQALARGRRFEESVAPLPPVLRAPPRSPRRRTFQTLFQDAAAIEPTLTADGGWVHYPCGGLHIYRSRRAHLTACAVPVGQNGNGGHNHNDLLSIELQVDGVDIVRDPGTFLYTPVPELRNLYRSAAAHNGPCPAGQEQNQWVPGRRGLFRMRSVCDAYLCDVAGGEIVLALQHPAGMCIRRIEVEERRIVVEDLTDWQPRVCGPPPHFSNGYGRRLFLKPNIEERRCCRS
jgi:hypothetical protein